MIRGTLVIFTKNEELYQSLEFNGGMNYNCYGKNAFKVLEKIETKEDFKNIVIEFNNAHHKYNDEEKYIYKCKPVDKFLNGFIKNSYFKYWFSDYVFFKNASDKNIFTKDYDGNNLILPMGKVILLNFGKKLNIKEV